MKKITIKTFLFVFAACIFFLAACNNRSESGIYNIKDFGAVVDTQTISTEAVQDAINKASEEGGGKVIIPRGTFIIGTIILKDNVTLELSEGATLKGSPKHEDYLKFPVTVSVYPDKQRAYLIYAKDAKNIAIQGKGTINGNGTFFWEPFDTLPRWIVPLKGRVSNMIELINCSNVKINDVLLTNSPEWTMHMFDCDEVTVTNIRLINNLYGPNNDGIDISGCRNVMISGCYIKTCDDAICLKSFPNSRTSYNIAVTNCVMQTTCVALKLGETYRDIHDVTFSNCVIYKSSRAVGIYAKHGGSLSNINISNIVCNTNAPLVLNRPIQISQYKTNDLPLGSVKNVIIENFICTTEGRILITANDPGRMENIFL